MRSSRRWWPKPLDIQIIHAWRFLFGTSEDNIHAWRFLFDTFEDNIQAWRCLSDTSEDNIQAWRFLFGTSEDNIQAWRFLFGTSEDNIHAWRFLFDTSEDNIHARQGSGGRGKVAPGPQQETKPSSRTPQSLERLAAMREKVAVAGKVGTLPPQQVAVWLVGLRPQTKFWPAVSWEKGVEGALMTPLALLPQQRGVPSGRRAQLKCWPRLRAVTGPRSPGG